MMRILRSGSIAATLLAASFLSAPAFAVDLNPTAEPTNAGDYAPKGMPVGGFRIFPTLDILGLYDDNVFKTPSPTIGSVYFVERPEVRIASQWTRNEFDVYGGTELFEYTHTTTENITNYNVGANGRLDIYNGVDFIADGSFQILHEPRSNPDLQSLPGFAARPTQYARTKLDAALEYHPYHFSLSVGGSFERLDYSRTPLTPIPGGGVFPGTYRNSDEWDGFVNAGYEFSPGYAVFVRANYDTRGYDDKFDLSFGAPGIHRASNGYTVDAGVDMQVTDLIVGSVYGGYLEQLYHDPHLSNVNGFDFGAKLVWTPDPLWTVKLDASHIVNNTIIANASSENDQNVRLTVDWSPLAYLVVEGYGGYINSDFAPNPRRDNYLDAGISAKYILNRYMALKAGYLFERRDSNQGFARFTDNQFEIGLLFQE